MRDAHGRHARPVCVTREYVLAPFCCIAFISLNGNIGDRRNIPYIRTASLVFDDVRRTGNAIHENERLEEGNREVE